MLLTKKYLINLINEEIEKNLKQEMHCNSKRDDDEKELEEMHCTSKRDDEEELEEGKGKYDDGDGKDEKCDYVDCEGEDSAKKDESLNSLVDRLIVQEIQKILEQEEVIAEKYIYISDASLDDGTIVEDVNFKQAYSW